MAAHQPDCQVSVVSFILQAACRFKLPSVRQAAIRWLRQNNRRPTGELLIRLKLAELEEICCKKQDWNKSIDRIIDLFDFITPKDPEQTSFISPWFYMRNFIIIGAAIKGYDDTTCLESCNKHLLRMPFTEHGSPDYSKKQTYLSKVSKELASYNGTTDKALLKKDFPLVIQYLQKNLLDELTKFLETFNATLQPNYCFLEAAAECLQNVRDPDARIEIHSDAQNLGFKFLLEQFEDVEMSLNGPKDVAENRGAASDNIKQAAVDTNDGLYRSRPTAHLRRSSNRSRHREQDPRNQQPSDFDEDPRVRRKRSIIEARDSGRAIHDGARNRKKSRKSANVEERLDHFQKTRRSVHRAAEKIPDARERAFETARRIHEALEQGVYEHWSDTEARSDHENANVENSMPAGPEYSTPSQNPSLSEKNIKAPSSSTDRYEQLGHRRSVGQWQQYEIEELQSGVAEFGVGQWSKILKHRRFLPGRTSVDLKDKYRNMVKRNLFHNI